MMKLAAILVVLGASMALLAGPAAATPPPPPPEPPPTPPPATVDPRAHFWGPCGDPFYRAVLDNRRSERAVKFSVNWKPYGDPRRTIYRWVPADTLRRTGLFDVAGSTRMTIRWVGHRVLDSQLSAPNAVYGPCPTGVAVIH